MNQSFFHFFYPLLTLCGIVLFNIFISTGELFIAVSLIFALLIYAVYFYHFQYIDYLEEQQLIGTEFKDFKMLHCIKNKKHHKKVTILSALNEPFLITIEHNRIVSVELITDIHV